MKVLIPVGLGFIVNLLVFMISKGFRQRNERSLFICAIAFIAVFISSYVIGSWLGIGIGVISSGMLLFIILMAIILASAHRKS